MKEETTKNKKPRKDSRSIPIGKFNDICEAVASGKSLTHACKVQKVSRASFLRMCELDEERRNEYVRAREACLEVWADEIIDISDEAEIVANTPFTGGSAVQAKSVRIDSRKWILSKLLPKKYGDASKLELTGADGGPVEVVEQRTAEEDKRFAEMLASVQAKVQTEDGQ
ncbi:hypothetical protein QET93_011350 [Akkermansia sp. N21116]|uniref:terminase small subunit-like protein n=1 Tax=Akkermansia sp. N21116 TaxID=3040764 RepID=UPI00244E609A|nr:hypothetical protein [Akkermansia sp. N21116]WPX40128.1 hypothetical protein QET93_011350 [Akkermansia sp. N21116]